MTPEEEAYKLAEDRIAEAKAGGWKFLNIGGSATEFEYGGEKRAGSEKLAALTEVPPAIAELTDLELLDLAYTQVSDLRVFAGLTGLQRLFLENTQVGDLRVFEE